MSSFPVEIPETLLAEDVMSPRPLLAMIASILLGLLLWGAALLLWLY